MDKDGNLLWHRSLDAGGSPSITVARRVVNSGDGGYVLAGVAAGNGINGWIAKVDKDGLTQWQKTYSIIDEEGQVECIIKSIGGGYTVAGHTLGADNTGSVKYSGWLFKIDESGNMLWQNRYSKRSGELFYSLIESREGEYVIAGGSRSNSCAHTEDVWVLTVTK